MDPLLAIIVIGGGVVFLRYIFQKIDNCKNENTDEDTTLPPYNPLTSERDVPPKYTESN